IRVIAISLNTGGFGAGLNDDASRLEQDYDGVCGPPGPETDQAATIAEATGGQDLMAAGPDDVSDVILQALTNLPITVTPTPTCDKGLTAPPHAPSKPAPSGAAPPSQEPFPASGAAPAGATLHCDVDYLLNGVHQDGFQQHADITVPGSTGTIVVK